MLLLALAATAPYALWRRQRLGRAPRRAAARRLLPPAGPGGGAAPARRGRSRSSCAGCASPASRPRRSRSSRRRWCACGRASRRSAATGSSCRACASRACACASTPSPTRRSGPAATTSRSSAAPAAGRDADRDRAAGGGRRRVHPRPRPGPARARPAGLPRPTDEPPRGRAGGPLLVPARLAADGRRAPSCRSAPRSTWCSHRGVLTVAGARLQRREHRTSPTSGRLRFSGRPQGQLQLEGAIDLAVLERHVFRSGLGFAGAARWDGLLSIDGSRLRIEGRMNGADGRFMGVAVPRFAGAARLRRHERRRDPGPGRLRRSAARGSSRSTSRPRRRAGRSGPRARCATPTARACCA